MRVIRVIVVGGNERDTSLTVVGRNKRDTRNHSQGLMYMMLESLYCARVIGMNVRITKDMNEQRTKLQNEWYL